MARVALQAARIHGSEVVVELARTVEALMEKERSSVQNFERPPLFASLAEAFAAAKDPARASLYFEKAMDSAAELGNSRVGAIACVDVCTSLARSGVDHTQYLEGLDRLLANFDATKK